MFRTEVIVDNATGLDDIEAGEAVWRKYKSLNHLILVLTLVIWREKINWNWLMRSEVIVDIEAGETVWRKFSLFIE